jgi:Fic family protein
MNSELLKCHNLVVEHQNTPWIEAAMRIPHSPPSMQELMASIEEMRIADTFIAIHGASVGPAPDGKYLHWDKARFLTPPKDLSLEQWWLGIKLARKSQYQTLPNMDNQGAPFRYLTYEGIHEKLHKIDKMATGTIKAEFKGMNTQSRDTYLMQSLFEEAIRSSQLEGASTTRKVAKEMLRTGREPRNKHERMIKNNDAAMRFIRENAKQALDPAMIFELHEILTDETLDDPTASGRLRTDDENIVVEDQLGNRLHTPPGAGELKDRMEALCEFANNDKTGRFMHPVIRTILIHFWLAYDHPFVDGNGRTARALFYWSAIHQGYWLMEYISISRILKSAPAKYARSFLYVETDANDTTYFIDHHLEVIVKAIDDLYAHLARKEVEWRDTMKILRNSPHLARELNHRQIALIDDALQKPDHVYTFSGHRAVHGVTYQTSRQDLLKLVDMGFLRAYKVSRTFCFEAVVDLPDLLEEKSRDKQL